MKLKLSFKAAFLVFVCLLFFGDAYAVKIEKLSFITPKGVFKSRDVVSGQAFVKFSGEVSSQTRKQLLKNIGAGKIKEMDFIGWTLVKLPNGMRVSGGLKSLKKIKGIDLVAPNNVYRPSLSPNDPASQYALGKINAYGGWEYETGFTSTVTVAVMDTGIEGTHSELLAKLAGISHQFFNPNGGAPSVNTPPTAACDHATRVAGIAAASTDNSVGIAGISWGAKLLSLKVFDDGDCNPDCSDSNFPSKICVTTEDVMIDAINYAASVHNSPSIGRIVLNMSLGGDEPCGGAIQSAINAAAAAGIVIIASAGNDPTVNVNSPANCANVIPVGATDSSDNLAYFSTTGIEMAQRGVVAPGVGIYTTDLSGGFTSPTANGTSFSAPIVSGLAALIISANPLLTVTDVGRVIRKSADDLGAPGPDNSYGWGRVNAFKALKLEAEGSLAAFEGEKKGIAFPNPFYVSKDKRISFAFPSSVSSEGLEIKIYNTAGELIKKTESLAWDGKNKSGFYAATGVYIFRIKTDEKSFQGKFALIR